MGELSSSPPSHLRNNSNNNNNDFMAAGCCFQEQYGGDDLFATYIDLDKVPLLEIFEGGGRQFNNHHQHEQQQHGRCNSGSNNSYSSAPDIPARGCRDLVLEAKKAMPPDKLAKLWTIDPKRAKRYFFSPISSSSTRAYAAVNAREEISDREISVRLYVAMESYRRNFSSKFLGRISERIFFLHEKFLEVNLSKQAVCCKIERKEGSLHCRTGAKTPRSPN